MKIVFITPFYPPTICGVGDHTFHLASEMVARGIEVHVVCLDNQIKTGTDGITVHAIVKRWNTEGGGSY